MNIHVNNIITITDPTDGILKYCKERLTFGNPDYLKKQRMGFWVGNTPKEIKLYSISNNQVEMPFGCFKDIWDMRLDCNLTSEFPRLDRLEIQSNIQLREYQQHAVDCVKKYKNGILVIFAGGGKTQCALQTVKEIGLKTLWITHTQDLLRQAQKRALDNMPGIKVGEITEGKMNIAEHITFATVQTLEKFCKDETISKNEFGMVIVDECHRVAVSADSMGQFTTCINYFNARYKLGLTATLHRAEGLEEGICKTIGEPIYEMKKDIKTKLFNCVSFDKKLCSVPITMFQVPAKVQKVYTDYTIIGKKHLFDADGGTVSFTKLITDLGENTARNNLIRQYLLQESNNFCLILSDRVEHLRELAKGLDNAAVVDGKTKKDIREYVFEQARQGKLNYVLASTKLAKEGLDIPRLNRLFLATPNKDLAIIVQSLGRVQRPFEGKKEAIVYDFCDKVGLLEGMERKRNKIYKDNDYEVTKI